MRTGLVTTGLALAGLLGVSDLATAGTPGVPPIAAVIAVPLGLITLAGLVPAWRSGSRGAVRAVVASRALSALVAVPGLTAGDAPGPLKVAVAAFLLVSVAAIVLLAPTLRERRARPGR
ncbi:hypothetical protein [Nonomuraea rhodomycinica]|uniref:Uncharacterized protein n=1 Tax=Nonomuraea rhodomycinica TaxID=1712872 RepID=A0A7Y6ILA8_9ACTN|nr:hypothetical protein [Nonomuraea rhodomycinica]NUW39833.1 hypothetical protein [Nonomuraea rhodomycinica]